MAQQHLGVAEEQGAMRRECEMQAAQHVSLSVRVQIHQRVATDQQVYPRNRSVLHEIVSAEDHRATEVLAEDVTASCVLEIPLAQIGRHRFDGLGIVGRRPRIGECILVDVGRIDLDPLPEFVRVPEPRPTASPGCMPLVRRRNRRSITGSGQSGRGPASSAGMTSSLRTSQAGGSRKNAVTLIRIVLNNAANSSERACRTSRYSS